MSKQLFRSRTDRVLGGGGGGLGAYLALAVCRRGNDASVLSERKTSIFFNNSFRRRAPRLLQFLFSNGRRAERAAAFSRPSEYASVSG